MKLMDENFLRHKRRYVLQCLVASVFFMINMLILDVVLNEAIVASVGATCFIIFTMPHRLSSRPRIILGGYFLGGISGTICQLLLLWDHPWPQFIVAGLAVGDVHFHLWLSSIWSIRRQQHSHWALLWTSSVSSTVNDGHAQRILDGSPEAVHKKMAYRSAVNRYGI